MFIYQTVFVSTSHVSHSVWGKQKNTGIDCEELNQQLSDYAMIIIKLIDYRAGLSISLIDSFFARSFAC